MNRARTPKPLLAYAVSDDEGAVVVFAVSNAPARRLGANELDVDFHEVTCKRARDFDKYVAQGDVGVMDYLKEGWWQRCVKCGRHMSLDRAIDIQGDRLSGYDTEPSMQPQEHDGHAYCSDACWEKEQADRAAMAERIEDARQTALGKWPGVTITQVLGNNGTAPPHVLFQLPGTEGPDGALGWTVGNDHVIGTEEACRNFKTFERMLENVENAGRVNE